MPKSAASKSARKSKTVKLNRDRTLPIVKIGESDLRSRFSIKSSTDGQSVRIRGRELLTKLSVTSTTVYGDNLIDFLISPTTLPGRISRIASTYERFKFHGLTVDFTPTVAATEPGAFVFAYDVDVNDEIPTGPSAVARLLTNQTASLRRVCAPFSHRVALDMTMPYMYVSPTDSSAEPRTEYQGQFIFNWAGEDCDTAKVFGHVFIDYDVELRNPQVEDLGLSGVYPTSRGVDPVLSSVLSHSDDGHTATRVVARLTHSLEKTLSSNIYTWLSDTLTQAGGSYKIPLVSKAGWNERFIELAVGKTLNILVAYAMRRALARLPAVAAGVGVAAVPETREDSGFGLASETYGTSAKDSLFRGVSGTPTGVTDYALLMFAKNGSRMIISGDPAVASGARYADYIDITSIAATNKGMGSGKLVMSTDTPTRVTTYPNYQPEGRETSELLVVSGVAFDETPLTETTVSYWISIHNDTDQPAYLTTYAVAHALSNASVEGYTAGGFYPFEATLEGTNYPPCVTIMPDKPDYLETVHLSEAGALLSTVQGVWPALSDEVAASAASAEKADKPAVAGVEEPVPFRVPLLDAMPKGRLGRGGH